MTSQQILDKVKRKIRGVDPAHWSSEEILDDYANEVQRYMCREIRKLIREGSYVGEVLATGTITLAGASGSIASAKVNGITVTSGSVPFNGTIEQTATDLAANITAYTSTPNYTATASGEVVTISAVTGTGSNPNTYVILVTATTITATVTAFSGGTSMCEMYPIVGKSLYDKHSKMLEVYSLTITNDDITTREIPRISESDLNQYSSWRTATGTPSCFVEYVDKIRLYPIPTEALTANLSVYRLPLVDLSKNTPTASPEIHEMFHDDMIPGILQRCYEKDDQETLKPGLAEKYQAMFEQKITKIGQEILSRSGGPATVGYQAGMV